MTKQQFIFALKMIIQILEHPDVYDMNEYINEYLRKVQKPSPSPYVQTQFKLLFAVLTLYLEFVEAHKISGGEQ